MDFHVEKRYKKSWTVIIEAGRYPNGKRRRILRSFKGPKVLAERAAVRFLHELQTGTYVEPTQLSLGQYLDQWLRTYAKPSVAPSTYARYEGIVTQHLSPALGAIPLQRLHPTHIQTYYAEALEKGRGERGLAPRSVQQHHAVLHEALEYAVRWQLITHNPADAVVAPRPERPDIKALDAGAAGHQSPRRGSGRRTCRHGHRAG